MLASLTPRGQALLAAGVTAALCGLVLGERDLTRIGVLVATAPLLAAAYCAVRRPRVTSHRTVEPVQVPVGGSSEVHLVVTAQAECGPLEAGEVVPRSLGEPPSFHLDPRHVGQDTSLSYRIAPRRRGRLLLGPLQVRLADPFGLAVVATEVTGRAEVVVTPTVLPLPRITLTTGESGDTGESASSFATGHVADVLVREYRTGDDLRRIHWRSTAHTGELMVRREELPRQATATLLLETRSSVHRAEGDQDSLERAVVAAASIGAHLTGCGFDVRVFTPDGPVELPRAHDPRQSLPTLLRALALLGPSRHATWKSPLPALGDLGRQGPVVAVLGEDVDLPWSAEMAGVARSALAILVSQGIIGTATRPATGPATRMATRMERQGWRTARWGADTPLSLAWQRLTP